ncbi:MAG: lytic transglycosylase domain-containing protein [Candidatus Competibacteraceae bacterium]
MKRWLPVMGIACAALFLSWPVEADIYVVKDATGDRRFTENCLQRRCKLFLKTRISGAPAPKLSRYRSKSRTFVGTYDSYSYYSKALLGYPELRTSGRTSATGLRSVNFRSANLEFDRPRPLDQTNRKLYAPQIEQIARTYGLDPQLLHAVIGAESAYDPAAVSTKGAMGLMQLMPDTARRFGVEDPFNPTANLHGGARYLRWLMDRFQSDLELVLAAYNAGEGAVERYGNAIPPYEETRTYVARVLDYYHGSRGLN